MYCPTCGAENPAESKFCRSCGTAITQENVTAPATATPTADSAVAARSAASVTAPAGTATAFGANAPDVAPSTAGSFAAAPTSFGTAPSAAAPVSRFITMACAIVTSVAAVAVGILSFQPWLAISLGSIPGAASSLGTVGISTSYALSPFSANVVSAAFNGLLSLSLKLSTSQLPFGQMNPLESFGTLHSVMETFNAAVLFSTFICFFVVVLFALVVIAVYRAIASKGTNLTFMIPAGALSALLSVTWLIAVSSFDSTIRSLSGYSSAYGTTTLISPIFTSTWCVWVMLACGVLITAVAVFARFGIKRSGRRSG